MILVATIVWEIAYSSLNKHSFLFSNSFSPHSIIHIIFLWCLCRYIEVNILYHCWGRQSGRQKERLPETPNEMSVIYTYSMTAIYCCSILAARLASWLRKPWTNCTNLWMMAPSWRFSVPCNCNTKIYLHLFTDCFMKISLQLLGTNLVFSKFSHVTVTIQMLT